MGPAPTVRLDLAQHVAGLTTLVLLQSGGNPLAGKKLYVDPNSSAARQAETLRPTKPQDAELVARIAIQPVARWLGDWVRDIGRAVESAVSTITHAGALPVLVAY